MKETKRMNDYEMFHITRIINALMKQQSPYNTHSKDGTSDCGNYFPDTKEIISSLYELGRITYEEFEAIKKILNKGCLGK